MIDISIWGELAQRFVDRHRSARLAGVFARSLHLEAEGDFLCIGDAGICKGPLNAIVDIADWTRVAPRLPTAGGEAYIGAGSIEVRGRVFGTAAASIWRPPSWPRRARGEDLDAALDLLARRAREQAPADGIIRIVVGSVDEPGSPFELVARPAVRQMRDWLTARLSMLQHGPAPVGLLGLGPGLTPSGDDLLCGALVALHAIEQVDTARHIYAAITGAVATSTSALSLALLRAGAEGQCWEPLHATIIALLENKPVDRDLWALARIGHRSGWDALAGVVLVLQALRSVAGLPSLVAPRAISL
jgi:uncharacterized protein DUF2877